MHIAICDDHKEELTAIANLLEQYSLLSPIPITYTCFTSATELIASLQHQVFDLLLLDIIQPELSGMEAAHLIRSKNDQTPIIFLTTSPEFAVESYRVTAFDYLLKPVHPETFFATLDRLLHTTTKPEAILLVKKSATVIPLRYDQIVYLEVNNRTLTFHLSDHTALEIHGNLSAYESSLVAQNGFIKVHRAFIVNLAHVYSITAKDVCTSNGNVPLSRSYYPVVRSAYLKHLMPSTEVH